MKNNLYDIKKKLILMMKARGLDKDGCICGMLILETEENFVAMTKWLEDNPDIVGQEVFESLYKMYRSEE